MTCEQVNLPNGPAFLCGRGRTRTVCDVCDKTVTRNHPTANVKGHKIDFCNDCERRIGTDDKFRVWALEKALSHYEAKP